MADRLEVVPGYEPLALVLDEALSHSQATKGVERHANGKPFLQQQIVTQPLERKSVEGLLYQIQKKAPEAVGLWQRLGVAHAEDDLLGVINYAASMLIVMRQLDAEEIKQRPAAEYGRHRPCGCDVCDWIEAVRAKVQARPEPPATTEGRTPGQKGRAYDASVPRGQRGQVAR